MITNLVLLFISLKIFFKAVVTQLVFYIQSVIQPSALCQLPKPLLHSLNYKIRYSFNLIFLAKCPQSVLTCSSVDQLSITCYPGISFNQHPGSSPHTFLCTAYSSFLCCFFPLKSVKHTHQQLPKKKNMGGKFLIPCMCENILNLLSKIIGSYVYNSRFENTFFQNFDGGGRSAPLLNSCRCREAVLTFYFLLTNRHKPISLKEYTFIGSEFCRSEIQAQSSAETQG